MNPKACECGFAGTDVTLAGLCGVCGLPIDPEVERTGWAAKLDRYRQALERIAYPDGDEAAFYDWSVAEKIARGALEGR
jgi:hypothetical protein